MTPFKRTHTMFDGGEVKAIGKREQFLPQQRVRIVKHIPDDSDDGEDRYIVEFTNFGQAEVYESDLNPMPKSPATNEELLVHMCRNGSTAMVQAFMVTAIQNTAQEVVDNEDEVRANMAGSMISPTLWINTAKEVLDTIKSRD